MTEWPHWWIALLFVIPLQAIYSFGSIALHWELGVLLPLLLCVALFIPGAVRRLNGKHVLVMTLLAALWYGLDTILVERWLKAPYPYGYCLSVVPMMIIGLVEWLWVSPRARQSLGWILILSVGAGCLLPLICMPLLFTDWEWPLPRLIGSSVSLHELVYFPLLAVITWIVVPAGLSLGQRSGLCLRCGTVGLVAASIAAFLLYFQGLIYPIARKSLTDQGPFTRNWSVAVLETRDDPQNRQALWTALERADWSKPHDEWRDYRKRCIDLLARHDAQDTARRLSHMLRRRPSSALARCSAELLGEQRRYEAVPVLMRYALLGNSECIQALEAIPVPQAAIAVIRTAGRDERPSPLVEDFPLSEHYRERLAALLGEDAGESFRNWLAYYDEVLPDLPTPLSDQQAVETDRVVQTFADYWLAADVLDQAKCRLFVQRLEEHGMGEHANRMVETAQPVLTGERSVEDIALPGDLLRMLPVMAKHFRQASEEMDVPLPDWDAPDTPALRQEVENYHDRVLTILEQYGIGPPAVDPI